MIADVLNIYGNEVAAKRKGAINISYHISNLLKWWTGRVSDITTKTCRQYASTKSEQAARGDLKYLRSAVNYWNDHEEYGPLQVMPKFWLPEANEGKERWLTRGEAARLLQAAKPYQHLRRMILLGLYTGSRPGVILAMRWEQVDFRSEMMARVAAGVAQDKRKRSPKIKLGRRILVHLRRWKRLDGKESYICRFQDAWHPTAKPVQDPHGAWAKVTKAAGLEGVTRHTLRHTRATWMMQRGVPIWEAAGFLGMTVKTLERVYGHHSPDHQERAANI